MEILEQTEIKLDWKDLNNLHVHPEPVYSRSKGVHLSTILRKIAIETGQLSDEDRADEMPIRVFLGLAWEAYVVRLYPEIVWQPGELCRDKVCGTPDAFRFIDEAPCVPEFKFTHRSSRLKGGSPDEPRDIRMDWLVIHQLMGYINMYRINGYPDMNLAELHVCYANGNYTYPLTEKYIRYLIRFSDRELEGNWRMVKKYKLKL